MRPADVNAVLSYWFGLEPEQWWRDATLDGEIRKRFLALWEEQRGASAESFVGSPAETLAAVILFDQFPRNMFRDTAKSFASDPLGLAIAKAAIDRGYDDALSTDERLFLYLPFEHSERLEDQDRAVELITKLGLPEPIKAAKLHREMIARFGRFPHRNATLGREPTDAEKLAGDVVPW